MVRSRILSSVAGAALFFTLPVALTVGAAVMPASAIAQARADIDVNFFFGELAPHGSWVRHETYRYIWVPSRVAVDWTPYTQGRWAYVENVGWTFVSEEPFAWATYHYGRWDYDRSIGWFWVPGTKWAPAWVSWRRGPDYVGWAPLPPEGNGFSVSLEVNVADVPEDRWFFVPVREFTAPQLALVLVPVRERPVIYQRTEYLGPVIVQNNIVVNTVIDIDFIRERSDREVVVSRIERVDNPERARAAGEGETIQVFAPEVAEPTGDAAPPKVVEVEQVAKERAAQGAAQPAASGATTGTEAGTTTGTEAEAATGTEVGGTTGEAGAATGTEAGAMPPAPVSDTAAPATGAATTTTEPADAPADAQPSATTGTDSGAAAGTEAEAGAAPAEAGANAEAEAGTTTQSDAPEQTATPADAAPAASEPAASAPAATETPAPEAATEAESPAEPAAEQPAAAQPAAKEKPAQKCTEARKAAGQC